MGPEMFVDVMQQALGLIVILVSAIILPSLAIGLVVAVFQAATSINEQTLSFLPRLLVTLLAIMWGGHWITNQLMEFTIGLVSMIPEIIG